MNPTDTSKDFDPLLIKHFDEIAKCVGPRLLTLSNYEEDTQFATDMKVIRPKVGIITPSLGVRIRRPQYSNFCGEMTLRARCRSGGRTEIHKVRDGVGPDLFFNGFLDDDEKTFFHWHLINMALFAGYERQRMAGHPVPYSFKYKENGDGTAFNAYRIRDLPDDVVIHSTFLERLDDPFFAAAFASGR